MVFQSSHNDLEPVSWLWWKKGGFVAESSGRSPLPFLCPRGYVTATCLLVPVFLFRAIRMSSKFTGIVSGRVSGWGEISRSSWRSESVKNLQVLFFSPKALFFSSVVTPASGISFLGAKGPRLLSRDGLQSSLRVLVALAAQHCNVRVRSRRGSCIHSRNTWALGFARATPGNVSLQGCRNTGCFVLRAA